MRGWTQAEAIKLCRKVEELAPMYGCHVALTGGCLYKDGVRKDLDLLFYPNDNDYLAIEALFESLERNLEIKFTDKVRSLSARHWLYKAEQHGRGIDCFFYYQKQGYDEDYGKEEE